MKLDSYWLDTAPPLLSTTDGPVDGRVDVAVVGGGFTGLSAALALGKRGAAVAVLDAGRIGGGASGRNGGQVNTGVAQDFAALVQQYGNPWTAARAYNSGVNSNLVQLDDCATGTPAYVNDMANRLMGWVVTSVSPFTSKCAAA